MIEDVITGTKYITKFLPVNNDMGSANVATGNRFLVTKSIAIPAIQITTVANRYFPVNTLEKISLKSKADLKLPSLINFNIATGTR